MATSSRPTHKATAERPTCSTVRRVALISALTGLGDEVTVTALTNGNFVVNSPDWGGGLGAVTWGSGTTGICGTVSAANSLVGSTPFDHVGSLGGSGGGVTASSQWQLRRR